MNDSLALSKLQFGMLRYCAGVTTSVTVEELVTALKSDQVFIFSSLQFLQEQGMAVISEAEVQEIGLNSRLELINESELPEKTILRELASGDKAPVHIQELAVRLKTEQKIIGKSLKPLSEKGSIEKQGPNVIITAQGEAALAKQGDDEKLFALLRSRPVVIAEEAQSQYDYFLQGFEQLKKRGQFITVKIRKRRSAIITAGGRSFLAQHSAEEIKEEVTSLTSELLQDGAWKNVIFKQYDINADVDPVPMGRIHPFQHLLNQVRSIFYGMGFSEVASAHVESSFWNFDALFQPQDHPARDMQDTFYVDYPRTGKLPDDTLVDKVRHAHEDGGDTGSKGWEYHWNVELAKKMVLRTHTTAASSQQLYKTPQPPAKYFCIGRVFRREAIDYKHLPVFTQVDGIIVEKNASLAHLIDILSEFYRRMGFKKIEIRPSFFPYTEPSLEVHVWLEDRQEWVEMGGAGIFRKEVTEPLGCTAPVLAWGLGMERLAMMNYNLDDLRKIYISNIKWLREVSSCR